MSFAQKSTDEVTYCTHCCSQIPLCYITEIDETNKAYFCLMCGFSTNTMMVAESQYLADAVASLPQLYVDALYKDERGLYWYPSTVNMPQVGMVFLNGDSLETAQWAAIKAVPIKDEEREKFKIKGTDKYHTHKMDNTTLKQFGKDGFLEALQYLEIVQQP